MTLARRLIAKEGSHMEEVKAGFVDDVQLEASDSIKLPWN